MLATRDLTKAFGGVHAVDHLSISVERGLITALIGPNGSGKTTLVNLLSGMLSSDRGAVAVTGHPEFSRIRPHRFASYGITRTFQEVRLFEQMTVLDNLLVVLTERRVFRALLERRTSAQRDRAEELLRDVGLWEKRHDLAAGLSYGQRKLLEVSRALAMDAEIYLFDEPFAGLFPEMVETVMGIVRRLRERGKTVVLIEHDMGVIRQLADHVIVMDEGKLLAEGDPEEVLADRAVIEAYLGG
jgi:ABC-type branched-subunit amino acid transport system ATPase component